VAQPFTSIREPISFLGIEAAESRPLNDFNPVAGNLDAFMKKFLLSAIILSALASSAVVAQAQVVVPGTSDPWLAGQPNGTTASGGDVAPNESPVYAGSVSPGSTITWAATGLVNYYPATPVDGPNGSPGYIISDPEQNSLSAVYNVQVDGLMGVFLGPGVPSGPAPAGLDFSTIGLTYVSLSPLVDQVFHMGDGSVQSLVVPTGATRLFLGTDDGFGWYNNTGFFDVTLQNVTPPLWR
jgi:hypothetical protein